MKKNLILSFVFFAISLWMASYIVLPYFAIGGIHYYWYNYKDPVNALINIILPSLVFAVCLYFANVHFGKALPIVRFPVLWMIGIVLIFALISFGIFIGVMMIFPFYLTSHLGVAFFLGQLALVDLLMCSVVAFKRSLQKAKKAPTK